MTTGSPRIVVLGGGFGGLNFCQTFKHPSARLTLVDRQNHHLFQPLLYQVATGGLSASEIAQPIRSILADHPNVEVRMADVRAIRLNEREVETSSGVLPYDYLVVALGGRTSYFGHPEWEHHAPGLKSLEDAQRIRREVLLGFERAETSEDPKERNLWTTLVVVGGGPTGVELAGAFAELARVVLRRDFRNIDPTQARVILLEGSPRLLGQFPEHLAQEARERLEGMGVEVMCSAMVKNVGRHRIELQNEVIDAGVIVWAAGVAASALTKDLGVPLDRAGRILVRPDLSLPGHPEVFAVGDIISLVDPKGQVVPGVSPAAIQAASHVARQLEDELEGMTEARRPFVYWDKGTMATIGRSAAVAKIGPLELTGFVAWIGWLFIHLVFLMGFRNRIAVFLQWFYSYVTYRRGARIISATRDEREGS